MSKKVLIIEGDHNDGDYVTRETKVTDKDLAELKPIFAKMKKQRKLVKEYTDSWEEKYPNLTEEELEIIQEYVPYAENDVHTLVSVRLVEIVSDKNLL
jgi:uncharacterized protein YqeY